MPTNQGKDSRFIVFGTARYEAIWAQAIPKVREVPAAVVAAIRLTVVMECRPDNERASVRPDVECLDHVAPLLRFLGDEFPERGRCH